MKASTVLLLILCMVILNCSGPAEELPFPNPEHFENILGKWHPTATILKGVSYSYADHGECGKDFLEFSREGIVRSVNLRECRELLENSGSFNIAGYILSIQYSENEEIQFQIAKLDSISMDLIFIDHFDGDGITEERRTYHRE